MSLMYSNRDIAYQNPEDVNETEVKTDFLRHSKIHRGDRFLKGPIPFTDIAIAAQLPGKSLAIFVAVHHQIALTGKPTITLPARLLADLGCSRSAKSRGLKALEHSGLITVTRPKGRTAQVQLKKPSTQ
jgi:hypothetical protein